MVRNSKISYKNLEDYGIIGDLHSVALVGIDGSIDWYCYPNFDSPSVFAAILDYHKGGRFQIRSVSDATQKQQYVPETNVLVTRFLSTEGVGEVTDFMPVTGSKRRIIRRVSAVRGQVSFHLECRPAFDYARVEHDLKIRGENVAVFRSSNSAFVLTSPIPLTADGKSAQSTFSLAEGHVANFTFEGAKQTSSLSELSPLSDSAAQRTFEETVNYWQNWLSKSQYRGRWRSRVNRSALVLKLLSFEPTGAIIAAPTCSLPELIGGERNWDYRYTWIRDAAFTIYALLHIGLTDEARDFMTWLMKCIAENKQGKLQPVYRINGERQLHEQILRNLEGYRKSSPVRIGNAASEQLQLDVYGALMDAVYLFNKHATPISYDLWVDLRRMLDWLCENWQQSDSGIWEIRSKPRQFVYSKLMCWVALDRGIRLAHKRGFPADVESWRKIRDLIYEEIMARGWNERRQAFTQSYESDELDASSLIMPLVFFVSPTDPRMLRTLDAIMRELASDHLVQRYKVEHSPDGLPGTEGTFSLCTFWLVEALTRAGRLDEAKIIFEKMLGYTNHVGLYAEEIGFRGEALGNFPQAFTHLALITAAINLDRALGSSP